MIFKDDNGINDNGKVPNDSVYNDEDNDLMTKIIIKIVQVMIIMMKIMILMMITRKIIIMIAIGMTFCNVDINDTMITLRMAIQIILLLKHFHSA